MDKNKALANYRSNPAVKKIMQFIKDDKNWVYDLFEVVQKRVSYFFKLSYYQNKELENNLTLVIFGILLLSIVEADDGFTRKLNRVSHVSFFYSLHPDIISQYYIINIMQLINHLYNL